MKTNFLKNLRRIVISCSLALCCIALNASSQTEPIESVPSRNLIEGFENMTGIGAYTGAEVTFTSGLWYIKGYTTMDANDRYNETRSIRLRGNATDTEHRAEMMFDKANGAGIVTFKYGSYSAHAGGKLQLQISTDQGASWQNKGDEITVPSWVDGGSVLQTASITVNQAGNVRFRILKSNAAASSSVNIDDIDISDFSSGGDPSLSVTPPSLAFENVTISTTSPGKTLTISGSNLTGNITYVKSGADAAAFTITETSWSAETGGTLTVTFAPTAVRAYNAIITISSTEATDKVVTLSGAGVTAPTPELTVNPSTLVYGNIATGTTSAAKTITVSGVGLTGNITYVKSGADATAFTITETSWNAATGGTLSVTFAPTAVRAYNAVITISSAGAMNKVVTLSGAGVTASDFLWGDSFDYTAGSLLSANGWSVHSDGGGTPNPITISAGSLSYLNYAPSNVGNKVTMANVGQDVNHEFTETTSGTLYAAFMVNLTSAKAAGDYFTHFMGQSTSTFSGRVFAKLNGTGFQLGVAKSTANAVYATQTLDFGTTYLVVMKYEIVSGVTNDIVSLYIDPVVGSSEPATPSAAASDVTGTDPTQITGFALRQGTAANAPELAFDGVRVAKTWAEAVKYEASTTPTLTVSPGSLNFGETNIGTTTTAKTITVSGVNLTGNITYVKSGADATAFNLTASPWNAATGGTLNVTFSPTTIKTYNAIITISSAGATDKVVSLTGIGKDASAPPVANFSANMTTVTVGGSVQFTDLSTGTPTSWSWTFAGGTPGTSTQQNPSVIYNTIGVYNVSLKATNANGNHTETKTNYITVVAQGSNLVCNNGFETWTDGKPNCWFGAKTSFATANVLQYATSPHSGTSSCQLVETTSTHKRFTTQPISVTSGETYQIRFWVRGQSEIRTGLFDERATGNGYANYNEYVIVNSTTWAQYTQQVTAENTSSIAEFIFSVRNTVETSGHLQIDDVEITAGGTPTPTLTVNPTSLSFGNVNVGVPSTPKTITVSGSNLTENITYVKGGTDASAFVITENPWNVATGGTLSVVFTPTAEKTFNANIVISSPGAENKTVTLTGTGGSVTPTDFFEDFENMTGSGSYNGAEVTFASGLWYIKGYTTMDANDRYNGTRSIRLRGNATDTEHRAEMMFDKDNGAGIVTFKYASYSSHAGGKLQLQTSTNQGVSWENKGEEITAPSWADGENALQTASIDVNQEGNIRVRIIKTNAAATTSVNIDDIEISDFGSGGPSIFVSPSSLAFGNVTVQNTSPEKTLTISGSNLTGAIAYVKGGADASAFTVTETAWNSVTGGTLSVAFAPTEIRAYNATITISSSDASTKTVTLSGTGTSGGETLGCNGGFEEWTDGKPNCWFGEKTTFAKSNVVQYTVNVHEGSSACQLINTEAAHKRFTTQAVTVVAGTTYYITFLVRGKGSIRTSLFDARETNSGYAKYNEFISVDSEEWTKYTQSVIAETNATNAEFIFSVQNTDASKDHLQIDGVVIATNDVAIKELSELQCAVFPNPSKGIFNVKTDCNVTARVYSITGISLIEQKINEAGTLRLDAYSPGIYILKMTDNKNGSVTKKLIVQ